MIKHRFIAEKLPGDDLPRLLLILSSLPFFSSTHEIIHIAGYLLCTNDEYRVHHDHIWALVQSVRRDFYFYTRPLDCVQYLSYSATLSPGVID